MVMMTADPTIRRQVIAAARDVLSADPAASVAAITRQAGVSRATFYRHFGSRGALLASIDHEPRPAERERVLVAAQDMLIRSSLADLSMDELARAADVSRGTLYRLFPGKSALLEGLINAYSPFDAIQRMLVEHGHDRPELLLPNLARAVVAVVQPRLGLLRAIFLEVTGASEPAIAGMRVAFGSAIGALAAYFAEQMSLGRIRRMPPLIAVQAFVAPILFHLLTRPALERFASSDVSVDAAVDDLVAVSIAGLRP